MYKFHITGYRGNGESYWSDNPIDITVFAENLEEAIEKASSVLGYNISSTHRKVIVDEMVGEQNDTE